MFKTILVTVLFSVVFILAEGQDSGCLQEQELNGCLGEGQDEAKLAGEFIQALKLSNFGSNKNLSCSLLCVLQSYGIIDEKTKSLNEQLLQMIPMHLPDMMRNPRVMSRFGECKQTQALKEVTCENLAQFVDCISKDGTFKELNDAVDEDQLVMMMERMQKLKCMKQMMGANRPQVDPMSHNRPQVDPMPPMHSMPPMPPMPPMSNSGGGCPPQEKNTCFSETQDEIKAAGEMIQALKQSNLGSNKKLSCSLLCLLQSYGIVDEKTQSLNEHLLRMIPMHLPDIMRNPRLMMKFGECKLLGREPLRDMKQVTCENLAQFVDCISKDGTFKEMNDAVDGGQLESMKQRMQKLKCMRNMMGANGAPPGYPPPGPPPTYAAPPPMGYPMPPKGYPGQQPEHSKHRGGHRHWKKKQGMEPADGDSSDPSSPPSPDGPADYATRAKKYGGKGRLFFYEKAPNKRPAFPAWWPPLFYATSA